MRPHVQAMGLYCAQSDVLQKADFSSVWDVNFVGAENFREVRP